MHRIVRKVQIHAPVIEMTKTEIIQAGLGLGVDFGLTSSCYDPTAKVWRVAHAMPACLRLRGFAENGVEDPIEYVDTRAQN